MPYVLSMEDIGRFSSKGFIHLQRVCAQDELDQIRLILSNLFSSSDAFKEGAKFDVLNPDVADPMTLGQLTNPSDFAPQLRQTKYVATVRILARQILGQRAFQVADFVLLKPAQIGASTPWHQDLAYRKTNEQFDEITFWLPLQDVAVDSGCLQFVPGTHLGRVLPHRSVNNDLRTHGLECCEPPSSETVVSVPMRSGDCSIHHGRILHASPMNLSDTPRFAYIVVFRNPSTGSKDDQLYPWIRQKKDASVERRRRWMWHGGVFVILLRKFKRGDLSNMESLKVLFRTALFFFRE